MKKLKISIEGMHCGSCSGNVEDSLSKVEGVEVVSVSVMTHKAIIKVEESVSEESIKEAISKAGYKVVKIE